MFCFGVVAFGGLGAKIVICFGSPFSLFLRQQVSSNLEDEEVPHFVCGPYLRRIQQDVGGNQKNGNLGQVEGLRFRV